MSHPDDGTIQMLFDGELDAEERKSVESHIAACASCARRFHEAKGFLDEADRLVRVLEVPERPPLARKRPARLAVVRSLAWAASIVAAVGLGYWARPGQPPSVASPPASQPVATPAAEAPSMPAASTPEAEANASVAKQNVPPPVARAERKRLDAPAALTSGAAGKLTDEVSTTWRVIAMEEAVRLLGGQIRLIDGLTPDRVETGPGTAVAGADPALPVVRVVYGSGAVTLDEQRPTAAAEVRQENSAKDVAAARAPAKAGPMTWQRLGEIRFVVTGSVSADSIHALSAQVR